MSKDVVTHLILPLVAVVIIPGLLFIIQLNNEGLDFLDHLLSWDKFDSVITILGSKDVNGRPMEIKRGDKIFSDLLTLVDENTSVYLVLDDSNKSKIISIGAFATPNMIDGGPKIGRVSFVPPTTRVAINFDPSIIPDPRLLGFEKIPPEAIYAYPIGTLNDIHAWIEHYKSVRRGSLYYGVSLLSIMIGTLINFHPFLRKTL